MNSETRARIAAMKGMKGKTAGLVLVLALFLATAVTVGAEKGNLRVALVIGNGSYLYTTSLPNPPNDARGVAHVLRGMGFLVVELINADKSEMDREIRRYQALLGNAKVSLFFYAGHGLQIDGENYLVPTDASFDNNSSISSQIIGLSGFISAIEKGPEVNLVFLDACRNNPLADVLQARISRSRSVIFDGTREVRSVGQGLAEMKGVVGTLIAYATAPDNVAEDGQGKNSPFTAAFLKYVEEPGLEVRQFLTKVRLDVLEATGYRQVPWDHSSLTVDFYFKPSVPVPLPPP